MESNHLFDSRLHIFYHISQAIWMVILGGIILVLTWALVSFQNEWNKKRPGINLREF